MDTLQESIYPTTFFRVSLKAVLRNQQGEVLCVKEQGSAWTLPGGGLDHGETIAEGFDRELHEELTFDAKAQYTSRPIGHEVMYVESKRAWQLWVVFEVQFEDDSLPVFTKGPDADDVAWIDPNIFAEGRTRAQQFIYKYTVASV